MIDLAQCLLDVSARYLGLTIERRMVTAGDDADPARSARVGDPADGDFSLHAPPSRIPAGISALRVATAAMPSRHAALSFFQEN
ncbi:hypothetical protein [Burkholderia ubonensis]|uniref:hypothetical protein n=1 Tax=Burkholderia ubonensis TaxID=101571 RepID=UPI0012FAFAAD|nr:hypothetical protein [Burkholderia ubonensis]